jgi:dTDP-4-amino-4,6-dideoxygalactose transaminase
VDRICSAGESTQMILCADPKQQYLSHKLEIDAAIKEVLDSGYYVLGQNVKSFEKEFSEYIGVKHGIGVASGTDAITIALRSCGIGTGDEVITVSHTAVATVAAIRSTGATPVMVDIEPEYFTIDPSKIKKAITEKTKAIVPVHIYGQGAAIEEIKEISKRRGLYLIEDCAQSTGATYNDKMLGSFGDLACFSFYPTKNLGAIGDGGMILTNNDDFAKSGRLQREYGWAERYISCIHGTNSRLDEIQAAILRKKLSFLDKDNQNRIRLARLYSEKLKKSRYKIPKERPNGTHIYHLYVIRDKKRNFLMKKLKENDIFAGIHYPVPIHAQEAYKVDDTQLAVTEQIANEVLSLPMYPELRESQVDLITEVLIEAEKNGE